MRLGETRRNLQRAIEHLDRPGDVAFLKLCARDIHRAVSVTRVHRHHVPECRLGTFEVSLQQQSDAVVVPARTNGRVHERFRDGWRGALVHDGNRCRRLCHHGGRNVGDRFDRARHTRRVTRETPHAIVVRRHGRRTGRRRLAHAGERPLRVPPRELAVVHLGPQHDRVPSVAWNVELVMHRVGSAWRDQPHIGDRARHPRVSLVDRIAVIVELKAAVEVRGRIHGPLAVVRHLAAVEQDVSLVVDRLELDPDVERIDGAPGKEVTDLQRADDDLDPDRFAAAHRRGNPVERRQHVGRRARPGRRRTAKGARLFTDRECARDLRDSIGHGARLSIGLA